MLISQKQKENSTETGQECITAVARCLITHVWKGVGGWVVGEGGVLKRKKYADFKDGVIFVLASL